MIKIDSWSAAVVKMVQLCTISPAPPIKRLQGIIAIVKTAPEASLQSSESVVHEMSSQSVDAVISKSVQVSVPWVWVCH